MPPAVHPGRAETRAGGPRSLHTAPEKLRDDARGSRRAEPWRSGRPHPPVETTLRFHEPSSYSGGERSRGPPNEMSFCPVFTGLAGASSRDRCAVCQRNSALKSPHVGLTQPLVGWPGSPGSQDRTKNVKCHTPPLVYLHLTVTTLKLIEKCWYLGRDPGRCDKRGPFCCHVVNGLGVCRDSVRHIPGSRR